MLLRKEREVYGSDTHTRPSAPKKEGQPLVPKFKETIAANISGSFLNNAEIRAHI